MLVHVVTSNDLSGFSSPPPVLWLLLWLLEGGEVSVCDRLYIRFIRFLMLLRCDPNFLRISEKEPDDVVVEDDEVEDAPDVDEFTVEVFEGIRWRLPISRKVFILGKNLNRFFWLTVAVDAGVVEVVVVGVTPARARYGPSSK